MSFTCSKFGFLTILALALPPTASAGGIFWRHGFGHHATSVGVPVATVPVTTVPSTTVGTTVVGTTGGGTITTTRGGGISPVSNQPALLMSTVNSSASAPGVVTQYVLVPASMVTNAQAAATTRSLVPAVQSPAVSRQVLAPISELSAALAGRDRSRRRVRHRHSSSRTRETSVTA